MCITAEPNFPADMLFESVVEQAEIVINQLRPWHSDYTINAWTGMHNGAYDHMAHPLSVFGMLCVAHEKSHQCGTFAEHGKDGFYLGPALNHYRCWCIYITVTNDTRIADTVAWFPIPYCLPGHSPLKALTAVIQTMKARDTELVGGAINRHRQYATCRPFPSRSIHKA
jgi:hypothetical protein